MNDQHDCLFLECVFRILRFLDLESTLNFDQENVFPEKNSNFVKNDFFLLLYPQRLWRIFATRD